MKEKYRKQVELLIDALPIVMADERMALKGGTAINLFHRDLPRLSVDIDLCYLPLEDRKTTFKNLHGILKKIKEELETKLQLAVRANVPLDNKKEAKLFASRGEIEIKIEPNFTIRGSLFDPVVLDLSPKTQKDFNRSAKIKCLNISDTFGGKICAALDRQHPRDLFDIKLLIENEGIGRELKDAFIFYLLSHKRPINEVLSPNFQDIDQLFESEFRDMSEEVVSIHDLEQARGTLKEELLQNLNEDDKIFLCSFVENKPDWSLFKSKDISQYPAIKWKLLNQMNMNKEKKKDYLDSLKDVLSSTN